MTDQGTVTEVAGRLLRRLTEEHEGETFFMLPPGTNVSLASLSNGGLLLSIKFPESRIADTGLPGVKHE